MPQEEVQAEEKSLRRVTLRLPPAQPQELAQDAPQQAVCAFLVAQMKFPTPSGRLKAL